MVGDRVLHRTFRFCCLISRVCANCKTTLWEDACCRLVAIFPGTLYRLYKLRNKESFLISGLLKIFYVLLKTCVNSESIKKKVRAFFLLMRKISSDFRLFLLINFAFFAKFRISLGVSVWIGLTHFCTKKSWNWRKSWQSLLQLSNLLSPFCCLLACLTLPVTLTFCPLFFYKFS